jgi:uronate dehydrogenase
MYADKYGVSCVCLRIGTFAERPGGRRALSTWISPRDMVQLTRCSLDAIVYGVSANQRSWWDNPGADRLGYKPMDDAEQYGVPWTRRSTSNMSEGAAV